MTSPVGATHDGVRILDLSRNIAGPFATMILADLGADVIKVEHPDGGDDTRRYPPRFSGGDSAIYLAMNRNKRSVALDLKDPDGREAVRRLAARADVVVENFRPGTIERLGLGADELRRATPDLVWCSISAWGRGEIGRRLAGYDPLIQAFTGLMSMTGEEDGPPVRVGASIIDLTTGMWVALGIQAALARRVRTGLPQDVDASLVDSGYTLLCHQIMGHLATGEVPRALGSASPFTAPYEAFEAADGRLMIAAGTDAQFARVCDVLHLGELVGEPRFRGPAERVEHRHELRALLEARLRSAPVAAWLERLDAAGVPAGPIQDLAEAVRHPIVAELGLLADPEGERRIDDLRLLRLPVDDGTSPMREPPALGADTGVVLREAGLADELVDRVTSRLQKAPAVT